MCATDRFIRQQKRWNTEQYLIKYNNLVVKIRKKTHIQMDAFEHTMHTLSTTVSNWSEERLHITQHMPNIRCASMCDVSFIVFFQQNPISMSQWLVICLFYVYLRVYNHKLVLLCNQFSSFMSIMSEILHNLVIYSKIIEYFSLPTNCEQLFTDAPTRKSHIHSMETNWSASLCAHSYYYCAHVVSLNDNATMVRR